MAFFHKCCYLTFIYVILERKEKTKQQQKKKNIEYTDILYLAELISFESSRV